MVADIVALGEIKTDHGTYPVLGNGDWDHGQEVCQMGSTSETERCGHIVKKKAFVKGENVVKWEYDGEGHVLHGDNLRTRLRL